MRKKIFVTIAVAIIGLLAACGSTPQADDIPEPTTVMEDKEKNEGSNAGNDKTEDNGTAGKVEPTKAPAATNTPTSTPSPTATNTPTPTPMPTFVYAAGDGGVIITGVNDTSITKLIIPDALDSSPVVGIAENAFANCTNIQSILVDEKNTVLTSKATDGTECNAIISIAGNKLLFGCASTVIPDSVKVIAENAFAGSQIIKVVIPATVETVEANAFAECQLLTEVVVEGATAIDKNAFKGCDSINSVGLSAELVASGWKNVFKANKITKIVLLEGIQILKDDIFTNCSALTSVYIPASAMMINASAFVHCPILEEIVVDENNPFYTTKAADGSECHAVFDIQSKKLVVGTASTIIPSEITVIGKNAFYGRTISEIVIPDTVESVEGDKVFSTVTKLTAPYKFWSSVGTKK